MTYTIHPAAKIFPLMTDAEMAGLVEDIRQNGQRESIVLWKGQLIDGRNRATACERLGIAVDECELDEDTDPVKWVISHNLHRRNLNESQRALIAAEVKKLLAGPAKERQKAAGVNGKQGGRGKKKETLSADLHEGLNGRSDNEAGKLLNVSGRLVSHAEKVLTEGSAEIVDMVRRGEVKVTAAAKVVKAHDKKSQASAIRESKTQKRRRPKAAKSECDIAVNKFRDFWLTLTPQQKTVVRAIVLADEE